MVNECEVLCGYVVFWVDSEDDGANSNLPAKILVADLQESPFESK